MARCEEGKVFVAQSRGLPNRWKWVTGAELKHNKFGVGSPSVYVLFYWLMNKEAVSASGLAE